MKEIAHTAILTDRKRKKLNEMLTELFSEMVRTAIIELKDLDAFMKWSFERLSRS